MAQKERLDKALPCLCFAKTYYMSVLLRLRRTVAHGRKSSRLSIQKNNPTHLKVYEIIWRRRRDSTRLCLVFASQNPIICPCSSALRQTVAHGRKSSRLSIQKNNPTHLKVYEIIWRRRRDSNSRTGFPAYALSRGASSPT